MLINAAAGSIDETSTNREAERIREAFRAAGVDVEVEAVEGGHMPEAVQRAAASDVDAIVVGGGDGTISAAAGALGRCSKPLGILPLGTLNHFAKDLGIPLELEDAARTIAEGHVIEVDLGEVNGRSFINNSSIGLYPKAVEDRDRQRERHGRGKWAAMVRATLQAFRRFQVLRVRIEAEGKELFLSTPLVMIGNNHYDVSLLEAGGRERLDRGELSVYVARVTGRAAMLKLLARAAVGRLEQSRDFEAMLVPDMRIEAGGREVRVALDGEVTRMALPLEYRIRPKALRVLVPASGA